MTLEESLIEKLDFEKLSKEMLSSFELKVFYLVSFGCSNKEIKTLLCCGRRRLLSARLNILCFLYCFKTR